MTVTPGATDLAYLVYLRRLLIQRFDLSELRTLCFDLGVDAESVGNGLSKQELVRGLVSHLERRKRIPELVAYIRQTREDIQLEPAPPAGVTSPGLPSPMGTWASSPETLAAVRETRSLWSYELPGQPAAAPIVLGEVCLVPSQESGRHTQAGVLRALALATGRVRWEHRFENAVVGGVVPISESTVLVSLPSLGRVPGESALVSVDATGRILWRAEFDVHQISGPAVFGDMAVVTGNGHEVILLDLATGEERVAASLPVDVALAPPGCGKACVYIPCRAPTLLAVDAEGDVRWRFDVEGVLSGVQLNQTPLVVPPYVIASISTGAVLALTENDGQQAWESQVGPRGKPLTMPVSDGRRVFVGARDGIYALNVKDGAQQWVFRTGVYVTAPPVIAGDVLCVAGIDRRLHGVDRRTGKELWQYTLAQELKTSPALSDGDEHGPYALAVDCTGTVNAVTYPVPAIVHEKAERWQKAAQAWEAEGDPWRAAEAWIRHAEKLGGGKKTADERAQAWVTAAQLFAAANAEQKATEARRRYAEILGLPVITVEVRHGGLALNTWSRFDLIIRNEGYGLARDLVIRAAGTQFEGEIAKTQKLAALPPGKRQEQTLDVKPLEHGDSVPLRVQIAYLDKNGEPHRREETLYLTVAQEESGRVPGVFQIPSELALLQRWSSQVGGPPVVDVEIRLTRGPKAYDVELSLSDGRVFSGGHMPASALEWVPNADSEPDGRQLFDLLLRDGTVRKGWHVARGQAETQDALRRVRLRIDSNAAALHALPWELLQDDEVILSASAATPFSRYLPVDKPWGRAVEERPIRVLGVVANPRDLSQRYDLPPIDVEMEKYVLASAFAEIDPRRIRLEFLQPPVTLERLSRAMLGGYHWLHLVAHGRYNPRQDRVDLLMEDDAGTTRAISDYLFCQMLAHKGVQPQLVFLSVCQSALGLSGQVLTGLAPRLVQAGVPAVVAMRGRVQMRSAQKIAHTFYAGLAEHGTVDRAMNEARDAVLAAGLPGLADPVLFMRLPSGRLWNAG
ncbi:MAG: PQQ-binding-like beta-propeller repeat protein [Anaerolineae bacterium]